MPPSPLSYIFVNQLAVDISGVHTKNGHLVGIELLQLPITCEDGYTTFVELQVA